jgi:tRNA G26 N,N-dimethylase Trm1
MDLEKITENNTSFYVYKYFKSDKKDLVFYNPEAKLSRDLTVLVAKALRPKVVYDLNCGSGATGIRIAKNTYSKTLVLCDTNPIAVKLAKKNLKLNKMEGDVKEVDSSKVKVTDADLILVDPFGSPSKYYKNVIKDVKTGTVIGLKATDIAVLNGKYPKTARRQYDLTVYKTPAPKEFSIRSLLLFTENEANKHNKSILPIFSYATNYYTHVFVKVVKKRVANKKWFNYCENCLETSIGNKKEKCKFGNKMFNTEFLYESKSDKEFIRKMDSNYWKDLSQKEDPYDFRSVRNILEKAKNNYLFKRVYSMPKYCKKGKIMPINQTKLEKIGVMLPFDIECLTTNSVLDKLS